MLATVRMVLLAGFAVYAPALSRGAATASGQAALTPNLTRTRADDLELTGLVPNLPPGRSAFVSYAQLAGLPQTTVRVDNDPNFPHPVRVTGVLLETLTRALRLPPGADLVDALCTDRYRAHYPGSYMAEHHPLLGLKIEGVSAAAWARRTGEYDPSPYFITYAHFVPSFRVLTHDDEAQVPSNIIRLNVTTIRATFDRLRPDPDSAEAEEGFTIAKQNCLRCHFLGASGGTKSGRGLADAEYVGAGAACLLRGVRPQPSGT